MLAGPPARLRGFLRWKRCDMNDFKLKLKNQNGK